MDTRKHFIPLESNPEVFTELIHELGVSKSLAFHDVLSLEEPELLAFVPRPTLALVLVFPTSPEYESRIAEDKQTVPTHAVAGSNEMVMWYKQTIHNACGLYGILHAVSNGARDFIAPGSNLSHLLEKCIDLAPLERAKALEDDEQLEASYKVVALKGDTKAPESPEDEVDFHYICFVKSQKDGHLYELDGDRQGPVDWGYLETEDDLLSEKALACVKEFIQRTARDVGFSLLALAPA